MLQRAQRHLDPPMVVAVIALFAALGGGYATAFSGSGSLQKAHVTGLGSSFTTVRSLTGIGSIQARCTGPDAVTIRFHNGSGQGLNSDLDAGGEDPEAVSGIVSAGQNQDSSVVAAPPEVPDDLFRYHIYPQAADDKSPQADISLAAYEGDGDCNDAEVAVLALNTQG